MMTKSLAAAVLLLAAPASAQMPPSITDYIIGSMKAVEPHTDCGFFQTLKSGWFALRPIGQLPASNTNDGFLQTQDLLVKAEFNADPKANDPVRLFPTGRFACGVPEIAARVGYQ
jgi:hypothetical protein